MVDYVVQMSAVLVWLLPPLEAFPQHGADALLIRTGRIISCRENLEYPHNNLCCLNCDAGHYLKAPCTEAGTKGICEECDFGTFTEHANGLKRCFKCTQCRPDQDTLRQCTPTQDTLCQCRAGRFCHQDHACEVCKKCSKCANDEEIVRNCTSTTDAECKKAEPKPGSSSAFWIIPTLIALVLIAAAIFVKMKRKDSCGCLSGPMKAAKYHCEVSCDLCPPLIQPQQPKQSESSNSSACSSQLNLTQLLPSSALTPSRSSEDSVVPPPPDRREEEQIPNLVPVDGVVSLRSCFELFEELDIDYHKRFFRQLGLNDNVIKSREHLPYEDRIHELLNTWVEKQGKNASLDTLLRALMELNQRRTAENIAEKAIQLDLFRCETSS